MSNELIKEWQKFEDEFLVALAHHYNDEDREDYIEPLKRLIYQSADFLMIGTMVKIVNVDYWEGHWGYIIHFDGQYYHVSGGSIGDVAPMFDFNELEIM